MTRWRDVSALRVALADTAQQVRALRTALAALGLELDRPSDAPAAELRARYADAIHVLGVARNSVDALLGRLDDGERPTPVHPYQPICAACERCAHRRS